MWDFEPQLKAEDTWDLKEERCGWCLVDDGGVVLATVWILLLRLNEGMEMGRVEGSFDLQDLKMRSLNFAIFREWSCVK